MFKSMGVKVVMVKWLYMFIIVLLRVIRLIKNKYGKVSFNSVLVRMNFLVFLLFCY